MSPDDVETIDADEPFDDRFDEAFENSVETESLDPHSLGLELDDDPDQARRQLIGALAEARADAAEYLDTLQRVAADFDNYRKRVERDQTEVVHRATRHLVEKLLPSLDSFDAALGYETQTPTEEKILDGLRGTHMLLMETLAKQGLEPIEAVGSHFDPARHEAVSGPGEGGGDLMVSHELRRGYTLGGRVLRPSLVAVEGEGT